MQLPHHDRYKFSPINKRPDYEWPEGKRLAFYIAVNIEHFAYGTGLGHSVSSEQPPPDSRTFAWRDYGNRVGVWRLFDLLDELDLPACHLINTAVFDHCPDILEPILQRDDEIIAHGRTNAERQGDWWEDDEARVIANVRDIIKSKSGKNPGGWMGPWMSQSRITPDLLEEAGFLYQMDWPGDDQPFWMKTRGGKVLSLPYSLEINDSPQLIVRRHTAEEFSTMIVHQFEEMIYQSSKQPLVMCIALHTMIVGQPHRLHALRKALKHIINHPEIDKVWFTRPRDIYKHCFSLPPGIIQ